MLGPNIAYAFTSPTDTAGPTFEIVNRSQSEFLSLVSIIIDTMVVPKDRIFVLSNVCIAANPGAAQKVTNLIVKGINQTGSQFEIANLEFEVAADEEHTLNWQGEVWIQGRGSNLASLRFIADFNANANANFVVVSFSGAVIPRGNAGAY